MEAHHPFDTRSSHPQPSALPGAFFMNSITQTTPVSSAPAALLPLTTCTVAVIGLGYVGLPLAAALATPAACVRSGAALSRQVIGFISMFNGWRNYGRDTTAPWKQTSRDCRPLLRCN